MLKQQRDLPVKHILLIHDVSFHENHLFCLKFICRVYMADTKPKVDGLSDYTQINYRGGIISEASAGSI